MIYNLVLKEEADNDVFEAYNWYESRLKGLGDQFLDELENYLVFLEKNPKVYQIRKSKRRLCPLKRFPYVIVYEIELYNIIVYAVFNTNQNPLKLNKRK